METSRKHIGVASSAIGGLRGSLTTLEALEIAPALLRGRAGQRNPSDHTPSTKRGLAGDKRWRLGISWLDFKLGFRMLLRYPGLTVVGGLAIAFGVSLGAATFEWVDQVLNPTLPLDGGDRIVGIRIRDRQTAGFERQLHYDFATWRDELSAVTDLREADLRFARFWFWLIVAFCAVAMVLSMAGIYSVMAFTVSRRTREIGIRVALGLSRAAIAFAIFRRPLIHVAIGVALGAAHTSIASSAISLDGDPHKPQVLLMVIVYGLLMMGVCLLACVVPTRRALRIPPTEALRADA